MHGSGGWPRCAYYLRLFATSWSAVSPLAHLGLVHCLSPSGGKRIRRLQELWRRGGFLRSPVVDVPVLFHLRKNQFFELLGAYSEKIRMGEGQDKEVTLQSFPLAASI